MSNKTKNIVMVGLLAVVLFLILNPMLQRGTSGTVVTDDLVINAIEDYKSETGYQGEIIGEMKNFGCHTELWLLDKDGELLESYTVYRGKLY